MTTSGSSGAPAWDDYDAYLFDIDGTLLHETDAVHYFAFCDVLTDLAGRPLNLDGVNAHGNVDNGILRDALSLAGVPETTWRPRLLEAQQRMCRFVETSEADLRLIVLPGVVRLLDHLRATGAVLGVATGNLESIGRIKLRHAGLLDHFQFGGFSDQFEYRRDVFAAALQQARNMTGLKARICVIGDTPEDIRAAKANSIDVIATATGIYSLESLQAESPTLVVRSLEQLLKG